MPRYQVLSWRQPGRLIAADKAATRAEAAYTIYKMKWPVKKGGQLYIIQSEEPATLFNALDSMAAMNQILALVQDAEQGSDWRGNWWPQLGRWVLPLRTANRSFTKNHRPLRYRTEPKYPFTCGMILV